MNHLVMRCPHGRLIPTDDCELCAEFGAALEATTPADRYRLLEACSVVEKSGMLTVIRKDAADRGRAALSENRVLREALRQACHDGWADGEGAMASYLRKATDDPLEDVNGLSLGDIMWGERT